jgi:hypothetical protein
LSPLAVVLLVLIILLAFGGFGGYRYGWGPASWPYYGPGIGIVGFVLVVLLVLLLMGRI